jgi:hypothetical protein
VSDIPEEPVLLRVRFENGKFAVVSEANFQIKDGAVGLVTVNRNDMSAPDDRCGTETARLFEKGTKLLLGLSPATEESARAIGLYGVGDLKLFPPSHPFYGMVILNQPMDMIVQGGSGRLAGCRCSVPSLNMEARSLNHAYTLLSGRIETDRISHTGNVFQLAYYYSECDASWHLLDRLRSLIIERIRDERSRDMH